MLQYALLLIFVLSLFIQILSTFLNVCEQNEVKDDKNMVANNNVDMEFTAQQRGCEPCRKEF